MNGRIDIWMSGYDNLKKCFDLAKDNHKSYCGYKVVTDKEHGTRMFLYWYKSDGMYKESSDKCWFPYDMDETEITNFVWGWLKRYDMGSEPSCGDGSYGKGFHFRANDFGNCMDGCDEYNVAVIVSPEWFYYGK